MKKILSKYFFVILFVVNLTGCGGGGGTGTTTIPTQQKDTLKPSVISTTPALNSMAVGTNSAIAVTFNEAIDPASINAQTFILLKDGTIPVAGSVTCIGTTALFRPTENLSAGASYTANVTTGVKDLAGNAMAANYTWQFTTGQNSDITPPTVIAKFPASNSVSVALNSATTVTFNEAIDPASINAQTFILLKDGTIPVAGSVTYVGTTAQFRPADILWPGALYMAIVNTGVKDLAGNALAANVFWIFGTRNSSDADIVSPQVLSVSPPDGAINVPFDSAITASFNEPILPFEYGLIDGRPVTVTFNDTYTTVTMNPTGTMHPGKNYTASLRIKDMAGNRMPTTYTWRFSVSP